MHPSLQLHLCLGLVLVHVVLLVGVQAFSKRQSIPDPGQQRKSHHSEPRRCCEPINFELIKCPGNWLLGERAISGTLAERCT